MSPSGCEPQMSVSAVPRVGSDDLNSDASSGSLCSVAQVLCRETCAEEHVYTDPAVGRSRSVAQQSSRTQSRSGNVKSVKIDDSHASVSPPAPRTSRRSPLGFKSPCGSFCDVLLRMRRALGRSPLGSFMHVYLGGTTAASTSRSYPAADASLYPMPVPFPEFAEPPVKRGTTPSKFRRGLAMHAANLLCGHFSFLELGCPRVCPSFAGESPSFVQMVAADNLASDVLSFLRSDRGFASSTFAGGRACLAQQLLEAGAHRGSARTGFRTYCFDGRPSGGAGEGGPA